MKRIINLVLIIISLVSCTKENNYVQIGNRDLEYSILQYDSIIRQKLTDTDYMLHVRVQNLNDSVKRYYIYYDLSSDMRDSDLVVYRVKDKDVVFSYEKGTVPDSCKRISNEQYSYLLKKYFPKEYELLSNNPDARIPVIMNDDGSFILTFHRDRLVGKTFQFVDGPLFYKIGNQYFFY